MKIRVIVNPSAGAGAGGRKIAELEQHLEGQGAKCALQRTTRRGHATKLARSAIADGVDVLGVVGGDGTFSEVCQAFADASGKSVAGPTLALFPSGTGGDLSRTLGFDNSLQAALGRMHSGRSRTVDLGLARFVAPSGATDQQVFINTASCGASAGIARLVNNGPKWLGGKATFLAASFLSGLTYTNRPVEVRVDGQTFYRGGTLCTVFANGRCFGGGMQIAPDASVDDGLLNCVVLGDLSKLQSYALTSALHRGTHGAHPRVTSTQGRTFEVLPLEGSKVAEIEIDGETPGCLPLRISVLPRALRISV